MSIHTPRRTARVAALTVLALAVVARATPPAVIEPAPRAAPPPVISILPAGRTIALVGTDDLISVSRDLHGLLAPFLGPQLDDDPETVWTALVERIGFAPETAEGWRTLGIDPAAGVSLVIDLPPDPSAGFMPIALLRLTDPDRLAEGLTARGLKTAFAPPDADGLRVGHIGERPVALAGKQGWTAVHLAFDAPDARAGFLAWSKTPGDLADSRMARALVRPGPGWIYTAAELTRLRGAPQFAAVGAVLDGLVFTGDPDLSQGRIRLLTSERGQAVFERVFAPPRQPRPLARYVEPERMHMALALAPSTALAGLMELLPPEMAAQRAGLQQAGFIAESILEGPISQLDTLLTGQLIVLGAEDGSDTIAGFVVGLRDRAAIQARIERLTGLAADAGVAPPERVLVEGHSAYRVLRDGQAFLAVFTEDALLLGQTGMVEAALRRAATAGPAARRPVLGEGEVIVVGATGAGVTHSFDQAKLARAEARGDLRLWRERFPAGIRFAVRADDEGLLVEGPEAVVAGLGFYAGILPIAIMNQLEQAQQASGAAPAP